MRVRLKLDVSDTTLDSAEALGLSKEYKENIQY